MGRNNGDFQASALYHGTVHPFKEGDVITPTRGESHAYATPSLDYATEHAGNRLNTYWEHAKAENPTWNKPGGKQYDEWEKENPPKVYQVEPVGKTESAKFSKDDPENIMSRQGFKVVKRIR